MPRAPGGARRQGGKREATASGQTVRKGPWSEEEDAVLREHVRTHGPQDWSFIQSKGLLPRTGKSCRLRWVNKLRPNLKSGSKFSAEEERVVLDLQAQFGNKWARIATYLPGRTDNDVKNFWSSRKKRLARLQRQPLRDRRSSRSTGAKAAAASSLGSQPGAMVPFEGDSSSGQCGAETPVMDAQSSALVPYDQTDSEHLSFDATLPLMALTPDGGEYACSSNAALLPPSPPFDLPPYPLLDFPWMPDSYDIGPGFVHAGAMDDLAYQELLPVMQPAPIMLPFSGPFFGMECPHDSVKVEPTGAPGGIFGDLPQDMFDALDQLPPALPPPGKKSQY